jgi:hypothetical protein
VPSSAWLLRVVPLGDGTRWDVLQPRTGRTLDAAPTQELAVERALERLHAGGAVEVVVDGFVVRREVVLPPPVPRRVAVTEFAISLGVAGLVALLLGLLLDGNALITVLAAVNAANAVRLVRRAIALRRTERRDPSLSGSSPTNAFLAKRASGGAGSDSRE